MCESWRNVFWELSYFVLIKISKNKYEIRNEYKIRIQQEKYNQSHFSLVAVSFSAFADHGCIRFYLNKSSKITSNFPKRSPWTTQRVEIKEKMDNSEFATSMGNNRKNKSRILMTKWSLKTCIVLSSFDKEGSLYCDHKKGSVLAWKQELIECHNILIVPKVKDFYASVNSSSAQTPPPPPPPTG